MFDNAKIQEAVSNVVITGEKKNNMSDKSEVYQGPRDISR